MDARRFARSLAGCSALALALTLAGLARRGLVYRASVEPGFPEYRSDLLEARGFPALWWVVDTTELAAALRPADRFLAVPFAADFLLALILAVPIRIVALRLLAARRPMP